MCAPKKCLTREKTDYQRQISKHPVVNSLLRVWSSAHSDRHFFATCGIYMEKKPNKQKPSDSVAENVKELPKRKNRSGAKRRRAHRAQLCAAGTSSQKSGTEVSFTDSLWNLEPACWASSRGPSRPDRTSNRERRSRDPQYLARSGLLFSRLHLWRWLSAKKFYRCGSERYVAGSEKLWTGP